MLKCFLRVIVCKVEATHTEDRKVGGVNGNI